ncbi:MAG: hypothetical protein J6R88_05530, partial [Clostridia bacterium]|nr:hypothetical protein [Clostridia bacterium]
MGNFLRRFLSFIFGMIFGFVALATAVVTMGYTVYKNASLNDLGLTKEEVNLGGLNDATIEELLALVLTATKDPTSYTFEDLEEDYDFDVNGLLTSFGIDPDTVHPDDLRAIKKIAPFALISSTGDEGPFDDIGLGVLFAFIPEVDGVYPIFSAGARSKLRSYTIGEAFATDETGNATLGTIFNSLPLGSILSSMYVETFDANNATYSYVSVDGGILDSFGNVTINELTTLSSDIGYEFNEGVLADLGSNSIGNLLGMGNDGSVFSTVLLNTTISDLFVKNGDVYAFDFFVLLNDLKVGSLMGMTYCDIDTGCNLEHNHVEGWYDGSGTLVTNEDIAGAIMLNLYDLGVESLINGSFDVTSLTTGIYFGQALGFTKGNDGKWYDANGTYAGDLNNAISNISLEDCMNGELSIEDTLGGVSVGGLMGMEKIDGEWYDANGNLVGDDIAGDLMKGLYDKTFNDLTSGSFDIAELTDGIYFGKALGYTKGNDGRWYDDANEYVGDLNNAISNISLEDCMNGNLSVEDALGSVTVGGLMGMEKIDGEWYDADGNLVDDEDIAGELMKGLYDKTFNDLLNGELDIAELT